MTAQVTKMANGRSNSTPLATGYRRVIRRRTLAKWANIHLETVCVDTRRNRPPRQRNSGEIAVGSIGKKDCCANISTPQEETTGSWLEEYLQFFRKFGIPGRNHR